MTYSRPINFIGLAFLVALVAVFTQPTFAQPDDAETQQVRQQIVVKGVRYLKETGQAEDGSFSAYGGPGVTALAVTALLKSSVDVDDESVQKAFEYLDQFVQPNGGIYDPESVYKNYETSLAVVAMAAANEDGRFEERIQEATEYLKRSQWGAGGDIESSDSRFGGFGYGKHGRPDLSNTSYTVDALIAAGVDPESETMQRTLKFVSRCQNLESVHNEMPFAAKNPDGGFIYTASGDGETKAGELENGGLRSYASMTYAGLKSMLYADVDQDDPRVQAAVEWIQRHYDLESNPGMGRQGLFYYYHVFAKALDALGPKTVVDSEGEAHHWCSDLVSALASRQAEDGSWTNKADRWMEGDPNLVTAYSLLALSYCKDE